MRMAATASLADKVLKYEHFLNDVLRADLKRILDERDKVVSQVAEYIQLKDTIEKLQEAGLTEELRTKVDLGCNFYAQAVVPDATRIYVCVGYGFFVEFTFHEALKFIEKKTNHLSSITDQLTKEGAKVKGHIKLVLEGLREIQQLGSGAEERPWIDPWS